jgi:chromosome segregation ATPase
VTPAEIEQAIGHANEALGQLRARIRDLVKANEAKDEELTVLEGEADLLYARLDELLRQDVVPLAEWKGLRELIDQQDQLIELRLSEVNSGRALHGRIAADYKNLQIDRETLRKKLDESLKVVVLRRENGPK